MKSIVHVHEDHKFIKETKKYEGRLFNNILIILDSKNEFNKEYHDEAYFFSPCESSLPQILQIIDKADLLILYNLGFFITRIANEAGPKIKIVWRFFGYELYGRKLHMVLSRKTKLYFIKNLILWEVKSILSFLFSEEKAFYIALKRVDAMICVYEEEYNYLLKHWPKLPRLIINTLDDDSTNMIGSKHFSESNVLVIGNSRSYHNNHLEILDLIENSNIDENLRIKLPFNYGDENKYTHRVREKALSLNNVEMIDSFIPLNEFKSFYNTVDAMVNNSYRQFALGNILLSLHKGVKVYLNTKSPTFKWLKNEGFYVFTIENLKNDIEIGHLKLTKEQTLHNFDIMGKLKAKRTKEDFQFEILSLIEV